MEQQAEVSGRFCIEIPRLHLLQRGVWLGSAPESASSDLTFSDDMAGSCVLHDFKPDFKPDCGRCICRYNDA